MTSTPDLSIYRAIHAALRRGAHDVHAAVAALDPADRRRTRALARWWRGYAGEVLLHHTIEDDIFFPELVRQVPAAGQLIQRTDGDHAHLDEFMTGITAALSAVDAPGALERAAELLAELATHMDEHLGFEDDEILPLLETRFTAEEYEALDSRAAKATGISAQAAFTVPFVAASVSDAERQRLLGQAPAPFRVLYRLTRGRYARLTALALGPAREPVAA
jgi:hemerythrin-like domain-containing protein